MQQFASIKMKKLERKVKIIVGLYQDDCEPKPVFWTQVLSLFILNVLTMKAILCLFLKFVWLRQVLVAAHRIYNLH